MTDIQTYNNYPIHSSPTMKAKEDAQFKIEAHTSTNMKVKKPKVMVNDISFNVPVQKTFSDKEATKRMQSINTDIYKSAKKENEQHEFNFKRYFTIFSIITLLTATIAYFSKGRGK